MSLPLELPFPPMEARTVSAVPRGAQWHYEPKWDGFRCLALRAENEVELQSKAGKTLTRYFPEVADNLRRLPAARFALDGELVVPVDGRLSFDELLQRIHPAASRVARLARERPALYIVFDLLVDPRSGSLLEHPLEERRHRLEAFCRSLPRSPGIALSPRTTDLADAMRWYEITGGGLDGIMAKRRDAGYRPGQRTGMQKIKHMRTADCVVGGFRWAGDGSRSVGSLLLGLYDGHGRLNHVGFTSGIRAAERRPLAERLLALQRRGGEPVGFTGDAPGGPSRWTNDRATAWEPLPHELVAEVSFDHFSGGRFRHGTRLLRWRPDKAPEQCTLDQVAPAGESALRLL